MFIVAENNVSNVSNLSFIQCLILIRAVSMYFDFTYFRFVNLGLFISKILTTP